MGNAIFGSGDAAPHGTTDLGSDAESEDEGPPPATNRWAFTDQPKLPSQYIATEPEPASSSSDGENVRAFAEATKSLSLGEEAKTAVGGGGGAKTSRRSSGGSSAKPSSDNWSGEAYERQQLPIGVDEVFLKFEERLMRNKGDVASQIIRYHRASGQPLPYTADGEAFKALWKPVSNDHEGAKRTYDESGLPTCEGCGSGRTFELQLMPQLVSILSSTGLLRKKEDTFGLGWASAWVFTCQRDCGLSQDVATTGETWQEETVWLQFEEDSEAMKEAQRKLEQQNQKK